MHRLATFIASSAIIVGLTACCCPMNFGPGPGAPMPVPGPGPGPAMNQDDPAEKAAVDAIRARGGFANVKKVDGHYVDATLNNADDAIFRHAAALTKLQKLKVKSATNWAGVRHLVKLQDLTELELWNSQIDNANLIHIALLTRLKTLGLRGTKVTDQGIPNLAPLKNLEELDLGGNFSITNTAGVNIAKHLNQLQVLKIDNSGLGDIGVAALTTMPRLRYLQMFGTQVSDAGMASLVKLKTLEHLAVGTRVTNKGMESVGQCTNLRYFSAFNCRISDPGLLHLNNLNKLTELNIRNGVFGKVTDAGLKEFMKTHPNCSVGQP